MEDANKKIDFIWKAFTKGKKWAFSEIYNRTYDDLYRFGIKFINNEDQIKDIVHDLYYKLWQKRANLSTPRNLKSYLISSLRATIINHLKQDKKKEEHFANIEQFNFESSVEADIITREGKEINKKLLDIELNNLSAKQKEAIYLHYIQELEYRDVAEIMEISVQFARNLVHHGIKKLKNVSDKFVR